MELPTCDNPVTVVEGDALDVMRSMPAASVDLILTDPPYFRTVRESWDNEWETAADFLAWLGRVADEWRRVLKPAGSLYCFASPRMAARVELMLAERFDVLNSIVWKKDSPCAALRYGPESFRGYVEMSERAIFAEQRGSDELADDASGYTSQCEATKRRVFGNYIRDEMRRAGVTNRQVAALFPSATGGMTGCVSNWLMGYNVPTPEQYAAIRDLLNAHGGEFLRREHEELRREHEELRRPFFADMSRPYADVWVYKPVAPARLTHPCEKPVRMLRDILVTATRPGAMVLDCFAGSGSLGESVLKEDRRAVLIERDPKYAATARERVENARGTGLLAGIA